MGEPIFEEFRKIPRLSREVVVTEKIDGTNASILIADDGAPFELLAGRKVPFMVGSRSRWIFPEQDNMGFARWAYERADELLALGPGHHFGEWWGSGVQRGYGLKNGEKRFSLFNVHRWGPERDPERSAPPACCSVVPTLWRGLFNSHEIDNVVLQLQLGGSIAAPGYMKPEGVVVYHTAARTLFKRTIEKDSEPKGAQR